MGELDVETSEVASHAGLARERAASRSRPVVLMGEDDPDIQEAVSELLASAGYEVIRAGDGREMAASLESGLRPAVILLDLMMPGVNGHDFLAWRGVRPEFRRIPVVVFSASAFNEVLIRTQAIAALLVKPATAEQLLAAIARAAEAGSAHVAGPPSPS